MKWIKTIWYFLVAFIGMGLMGFFGLVTIYAVQDILIYLFNHCSDLMLYTILLIFGVLGIVAGWGVFSDGLDKLKDS